jgi:hypothetical protein
VRIAAVVLLSNAHSGAEDASNPPGLLRRRGEAISPQSPSSHRLEILGQNLLERTLTKLKEFGVHRLAVIAEDTASQAFTPQSTAGTRFSEAAERAMANYLAEGVDHLMLLRLSGYSEIDFADLFQFHLDIGGDLTQAYANHKPLALAFVQSNALRTGDRNYSQTIAQLMNCGKRYRYRGYSNRLASSADFHRLVEDALWGRCGLRPLGTQVEEQVWLAPDVEVDDTAVISGPAFVGSGSRIAASCMVLPGSAIERGCEVDCGTSVEESWITQETYLGVALDVRRAVVCGDCLYHVDRNVQVKIGDRQLIGSAARSIPSLASLGSLLWGERRAAG